MIFISLPSPVKGSLTLNIYVHILGNSIIIAQEWGASYQEEAA